VFWCCRQLSSPVVPQLPTPSPHTPPSSLSQPPSVSPVLPMPMHARLQIQGFSQYNPVYEFSCNVSRAVGQAKVICTSVSGHLKGLDFTERHRKWGSCSPSALFDAPVVSSVPPDKMDINVSGFSSLSLCLSLPACLSAYLSLFATQLPGHNQCQPCTHIWPTPAV
jgi:hypothetical protein